MTRRHITEAQIEAAVESAKDGTDYFMWQWRALEFFGICHCDKCSARGEVVKRYDRATRSHELMACPDCGGRGWTWADD